MTALHIARTTGDDWGGVNQQVIEVVELIPGVYHVFPHSPQPIVVGLCEFNATVARLIADTRCDKNRNIIPSNLRYLREVLRGHEWMVTGETLIFDWNGHCANGRHRLTACAETGEPIKTFCVFGVNPEAFKMMDQGLRRRFADELTIRGEKNVNVLQAALLGLANFRKYGTLRGYAGRITIGVYEKLLEQHPELRESAVFARQKMLEFLPSPATVTALHYLFSWVDADKTNQMFLGMGHMDMPMTEEKWCGPRHLRDKLTSSRTKDDFKDSHYLAAMLIKAWNAFYNEKFLANLRWRMDQDEDFPRIAGWIYEKDTGRPLGTKDRSLLQE